MHAATIVDGRLEWRPRPDPVPGRGEVLIQVRGAGLNAADLLQRAGRYPATRVMSSDVPGLEVSGGVVAVGPEVHDFVPGNRVMALVTGGAHAELTLADEGCTVHAPDELSWAEAAGLPEAFTTAHDALFTQCRLAPGERLCVHGGAGGVGVAAIQLGVAIGCEVVATVRDPARFADVAALGATPVEPESFVDHRPFDVVLELVGAPNLPGDLAAIATGGRISIIGVAAGSRADFDFRRLMTKRGRIHGSTLRSRRPEERASAVSLFRRHVVPLVVSGRVRVPIHATYPLSAAEDAYDAFQAGGKFGKIILLSG